MLALEKEKSGKKRLSRKKIMSRKDGMKEKQRGLIIYFFFFLYKNATKKGEKDVLYKPVFLITLVQPLQGNFFSLSSS